MRKMPGRDCGEVPELLLVFVPLLDEVLELWEAPGAPPWKAVTCTSKLNISAAESLNCSVRLPVISDGENC